MERARADAPKLTWIHVGRGQYVSSDVRFHVIHMRYLPTECRPVRLWDAKSGSELRLRSIVKAKRVAEQVVSGPWPIDIG